MTSTSSTTRPMLATLIDKTILGCRQDDVPEIQALGRTLGRWRTEIFNHHLTGASNGPTPANPHSDEKSHLDTTGVVRGP